MTDIYRATPFAGRITFLGRVEDRGQGPEARALEQARLDWSGIEGEAHGGRTRPACGRVAAVHPRDTEIANSRQVSVLGAEEIAAISVEMGLAPLDPALLGASLVLKGIPDLSHLPPGARLQAPDGATIVVDMINHPCTIISKAVERRFPGKVRLFKPAARGRRGIVGWVERPGALSLGDEMRLFVPSQRPWDPEA